MSILMIRRSERRARGDWRASSLGGAQRGIQIGPRIRVGGTLGKIGQEVKEHVLPSVGALAGGAALGPLGSLAGSAIEGATNGKGVMGQIGSDLGKGITNAGVIAGGQALLGGIPGLGGAGDVLSKIKSLASGVGGLGSMLGGGGGSGGGFSLSDLIDPALGGAALLNASNLGKQSTNYAKDAVNTANQSYDSRAPLRTAGVQGMLNPGAGINLGGLNSIAARNPFAKPAAPPAGGASLA